MQTTLTGWVMLTLMLSSFFADGERNDSFKGCLPSEIALEEIVFAHLPKSTENKNKRITVRQTLTRLKASCKKGKLVDGSGREIRFYRLVGCWGNPPEDYQEQLAKQQQELDRLKKKYTVIEISCNQSGDPRLIH